MSKSSREAQGLDRHVTDPAVLAIVAVLLRATAPNLNERDSGGKAAR